MSKSSDSIFEPYYATCEEDYVNVMKEISQWVKELVPEATEKISWGMPTFVYHGNLLHLAMGKGYVGFYPGDFVISTYSEQLRGYKTTKGSLHLPLHQELEEELIKNLIRCGKQENEQLFQLKMAKKKVEP